MNIFIDIDGTLTNDGHKPNATPIKYRIEKVQQLSEKHSVILWSGNGRDYAETFRVKHGLTFCLAIGKPHLIIDDNPTIRPNWNSLIRTPEYLGE